MACEHARGDYLGIAPAPRYSYVNAYAVSRCYGGPEEGGWYYDAGSPLASVPVLNPVSQSCQWCGKDHSVYTEADSSVIAGVCMIAWAEWQQRDSIVDAEKARLTALMGWEKEGRIGRFSVVGGDDFEVYIEDHLAVSFPEVRPHYE